MASTVFQIQLDSHNYCRFDDTRDASDPETEVTGATVTASIETVAGSVLEGPITLTTVSGNTDSYEGSFDETETTEASLGAVGTQLRLVFEVTTSGGVVLKSRERAIVVERGGTTG